MEIQTSRIQVILTIIIRKDRYHISFLIIFVIDVSTIATIYYNSTGKPSSELNRLLLQKHTNKLNSNRHENQLRRRNLQQT